ncbi:unnamed protein product [Ectocarpus sp. 13 AM-2016]
MNMLPLAVQVNYDLEFFGEGAAGSALLELTVTGTHPVAALHRQVTETYNYKQRHRFARWYTFAAINKNAHFPEDRVRRRRRRSV